MGKDTNYLIVENKTASRGFKSQELNGIRYDASQCLGNKNRYPAKLFAMEINIFFKQVKSMNKRFAKIKRRGV